MQPVSILLKKVFQAAPPAKRVNPVILLTDLVTPSAHLVQPVRFLLRLVVPIAHFVAPVRILLKVRRNAHRLTELVAAVANIVSKYAPACRYAKPLIRVKISN